MTSRGRGERGTGPRAAKAGAKEPPDGGSGGSAFDRAVAAAIRAIPSGQTLSYGGVALRAGKPRGARAVVQALRRLRDVPWWRVIRSDGTLAGEVAAEQAPRLRAEGVRVEGRRVRRPGTDGSPRRRVAAPSRTGNRNKLSR